MDTMIVRGGDRAPLRPCLWQPWLNPSGLTHSDATDDVVRSENVTNNSSGKEPAPSSAWRRERRHKEYHSSVMTSTSALFRDRPLDFSTTPRKEHSSHPPPPSYSHAMAARARRPCVIQPPPQRVNTSPNTSHTPPPPHSRSSASDPVIDEHFRRSLGKDYVALFKPGNGDRGGGNQEDQEYETLSSQNNNTVMMTGLSVDDHFAKALGDTWVKLQNASGDTTIRESIPKRNMNISTPSPDSTSSTLISSSSPTSSSSSSSSSVRRMPSGNSSVRNGSSVLSR